MCKVGLIKLLIWELAVSIKWRCFCPSIFSHCVTSLLSSCPRQHGPMLWVPVNVYPGTRAWKQWLSYWAICILCLDPWRLSTAGRSHTTSMVGAAYLSLPASQLYAQWQPSIIPPELPQSPCMFFSEMAITFLKTLFHPWLPYTPSRWQNLFPCEKVFFFLTLSPASV